jgi:hypothetical protein
MHNEDASQKVPAQYGLSRRLLAPSLSTDRFVWPEGGFPSARVKALPYSRATLAETVGGASFSSAKR